MLQSRLYDSEISGEAYGGVEGKADDIPKYKIYRELIEREISECENVPNFWGKADYYDYGKNSYGIIIPKHSNFGGYADWEYFPKLTKITVLKELKETAKAFTIGESGLCIECGNETSEDSDLFCDNCVVRCELCRCRCDEVELNEVINASGESIMVCDDCLESYHYCERCGRYHHESRGQWIRDWRGNLVEWVCDNCLEEDESYVKCEDCGEWVNIENAHWVGGDYDGYSVCDSCIDNYSYCEHCEEYHSYGTYTAHNSRGEEIEICECCRNNDFEECEECGEYWEKGTLKNGLCPDCFANEDEEE